MKVLCLGEKVQASPLVELAAAGYLQLQTFERWSDLIVCLRSAAVERVVLCGQILDGDVLQALLYLTAHHPACKLELWTNQPKGRLAAPELLGLIRPIPTGAQLQSRWFPSVLHWQEWLDQEPEVVHQVNDCEDCEGRGDLIDFISFKQTQLAGLLGLGPSKSTVIECKQQRVLVAKQGQRGLFLLGVLRPHNTAKPSKEPNLAAWRGVF